MDKREEVNRAAAEHVERMRKHLHDGKREIARQQKSISRFSQRDRMIENETTDYDDAA
jgi:hypothetical protein